MELRGGLKVIRYVRGLAHRKCSSNANFISLRLTSPTGLGSHKARIPGGKRGGSIYKKEGRNQKKELGCEGEGMNKKVSTQMPTSLASVPPSRQNQNEVFIQL